MRTYFLLVTTMLFPLVAAAQPMADRVPDDAIVYVGWSGTGQLGDAYEGSHLKGFVDSTDWPDFFTRFLPQVMKKAGGNDRDVAEASQFLSAAVKPMLKHPSAFYFGGLDLTNPRQPMPRAAFYCDAGPDAAALTQSLTDLIAKAPKGRNDPKLAVVDDAGVVMLTVGEPVVLVKPLSTSVPFKAAMRTGHKEPVAAIYLDGERLLSQINGAVDRSASAAEKERWATTRDALGIGGLKGAVWTAGFDGKGWSTFTHISAPAPRTGLLQFLEAKPLSNDIIKSIPETSIVASAWRFDFSKLLEAVREAGTKIDADFGQNYGGAMGYVGGMIGVEPDDLVEPLGDQWAFFVDPAIGGNSVLGFTIVNKLDDPAKALDLFTKAEQGINRNVQRMLDGKEFTVQFKRTTRGGVDLHYLAVPIVTPTWAIDGDRWYFGLYPQVVQSAVAGARAAGGKSILDNPAYRAMREKLGEDVPVTSFDFIDLPKTAANVYPTWVMISRYAGFADIFGIDSPLMLMPPMHELTAHLTPAGSVAWSDETGWYARSISPFPGSETVGSDAQFSVGTSALMVSILLPSLNRARETANRVKSASNLRQIGQGCLLYSNENRGKYPNDLGEILSTQDLGIEAFINPRTSTSIPPDVRNGDKVVQADWVNLNGDYVYKGAGKNMSKVGPEEVVAYEKPDGLDDGINILYGDGHVEFQMMDNAMEQINGGGLQGPGL